MSKRKKRLTLAERLRKAIVDSGKSHYRIWKDTGVTQPVVTRFVIGERKRRQAECGDDVSQSR